MLTDYIQDYSLGSIGNGHDCGERWERRHCHIGGQIQLIALNEKTGCGEKAAPLAQAVIETVKEAKIKVRSITTDNGTEFAEHEVISKSLGCKVYFAHPYSSWEKGAIEDMNGLIRQYIPKKESFESYTHSEIRLIQNKINARPRKKIGFLTPTEVISKYSY